MRGERKILKRTLFVTSLSIILWPSVTDAQPLFDEPSYVYDVSDAFLCETADFNCDGNMDFVVTGYGSYTINVFLGTGDGTFMHTSQISTIQVRSISVCHINSDDYPDLVTGDSNEIVGVFLGNGSGGFQQSQQMNIPHFSVNTGDLDGDGDSDLLLPSYSPFDTALATQHLHVFLCDGEGHFELDSVYVIEDFYITHLVYVPGDLNGDTYSDVAFVVLPGYRLGIMLGNGDGTLQPEYGTGYSYGSCQDWATIAAGDFNEDGYLDLAATSGMAQSTHDLVFVNDGSGIFTASDSLGKVMVWVITRDFNLDGHLDLGGSGGSLRIYPGNGDGSFGEVIYNSYLSDGQLGSADFDNDGDPDLVRLNDGTVYVYLNNTVPQGIEEGGEPDQQVFLTASPSPFSTNLSISVQNCSWNETVRVFDLSGREVTELPVDELGNAQWNGESSDGVSAPSGVYVLKVSGENGAGSTMVLKL
jgi:hypothetical protein